MKRILYIIVCLLTSICAIAQEEFPVPDKMAEFPGGKDALAAYLQTNLRYPESSRMKRKEGRVLVSFVIEKDGQISMPSILESPDRDLSDEALRVIQSMPKWKPAQKNGKDVKMRFTLPINFALPDNELSEDKLARLIDYGIGAKENPRGLYKLQRTTYEDGRKDLVVPYSQYKYCTDSNTAQIIVRNADAKDFHLSITSKREGRLDYTGNNPVDGDSTKTRIFDSNSRTFKLKWFQSETRYSSYYPWHTWSTEIYDSKTGVEPQVVRILDMLKADYNPNDKNPFLGCWHILGVPVKVDGMEVLLGNHQDTYMIMGEQDCCTFYNLGDEHEMAGYVRHQPVEYQTKDKGMTIGLIPCKVEWKNKDTFLQTLKGADGKEFSFLWKRSGLPHAFQELMGTDFPVSEIYNPAPKVFK